MSSYDEESSARRQIISFSDHLFLEAPTKHEFVEAQAVRHRRRENGLDVAVLPEREERGAIHLTCADTCGGKLAFLKEAQRLIYTPIFDLVAALIVCAPG